ncbi:hypothetical protein Tco_0549890, partial [Tanacetum coccineum]
MIMMLQVQHNLQLFNPQPGKLLTLERLLQAPLGKSPLLSLQFQMEECHLLLTDQVDLANPEGHQIVPDVNKPLPLGGPQGQ